MEANQGVTCPSCGTALATDDKFCTKCGAGITITPAGAVAAPAPIPTAPRLAGGKMGTARKWLMAIAIITLISGFVFYFMQKSDVEQQISQAESATAHMDPAERDAAMKAEVGMTFQEAVDHDRGMVKMLLATNIALSILYLGLWWWARKNPFTASVVALLLFITVILISGVLEPKTLAQGIIVKVAFIVALAQAIKAGSEERRLAGVA